MSLLTPISGSKSGHLGLLKRGFRMEGIAKNNFSQKSDFDDIGVDFVVFCGLGFNFDDFWCLGDRLEI